MEETLNQEQQPLADDDGYFDDLTDDDLTSLTEEEQPVESNEGEVIEETEQAEQEQLQDVPFLNIRYNKEDVALNQEQAIEYAQKGMNYDKLNDRLSYLQSRLDNNARTNGLTIDEYLDRLDEAESQFRVNNELEALKEQYPDTNEEVLLQLAMQNANAKLGEFQREEQAQLEQERSAYDTNARNDLENFMACFPDVDLKDLPPEVMQEANETHNLTRAYGNWARKQAQINRPIIEARQQAQQLNAQNQQRSMGSTTNVDSAKQDDFLDGWNSAD